MFLYPVPAEGEREDVSIVVVDGKGCRQLLVGLEAEGMVGLRSDGKRQIRRRKTIEIEISRDVPAEIVMEADIIIVVFDVDGMNSAQLMYRILKKIISCITGKEEARLGGNPEREEGRELMGIIVARDYLGDVDSSVVPVVFVFVLHTRILYIPSRFPAAVRNTVEVRLHVPLLARECDMLGVRKLVVVVAGEAVCVLVVAQSELY